MSDGIMEPLCLELVYIVANYGDGSAILHAARRLGIRGGTICRGTGTAGNRLLDRLGLSEVRKEIVRMAADSGTAGQALESLAKKFRFDRPGHGIVFAVRIGEVVGSESLKCDRPAQDQKEGTNMYHLIQAIVLKGQAEEVVEAASSAGARGGTIVPARGSGVHETERIFAMDIEPEKEIVMILSKRDQTDAIVEAIRSRLRIDEPGRGLVFVQDVSHAYGLLP